MDGEHNPYADESMNATEPPDEDTRISSAEFRERYGRKRFTSKTAPKAVLWGFLYSCHELAEPGGIRSTLYPDMESIKNLITTYEDMDTWNGYLTLVEWHRSNFNSTLLLRIALKQELAGMFDTAKKLINAEKLRAEGGIPEDMRLRTLLHSLTLEAYAAEESDMHGIITLRKNIEAHYRYILAYNTFIDALAEETKTPEYNILRMKVKELKFMIGIVNEKMEELRETVAETRKAEAAGTSNSIITPENLRKVMKAFTPVETDPAPIPEDKIKWVRKGIQRGIRAGLFSWHSVYFNFTTAYWGEEET